MLLCGRELDLKAKGVRMRGRKKTRRERKSQDYILHFGKCAEDIFSRPLPLLVSRCWYTSESLTMTKAYKLRRL